MRGPVFRRIYRTEVHLVSPHPTTEQQSEAQRIADILMEAYCQEILAISELLASKPDDKLLGKTAFEVRERVHKIGAKAIETALNEWKKGVAHVTNLVVA